MTLWGGGISDGPRALNERPYGVAVIARRDPSVISFPQDDPVGGGITDGSRALNERPYGVSVIARRDPSVVSFP